MNVHVGALKSLPPFSWKIPNYHWLLQFQLQFLMIKFILCYNLLSQYKGISDNEFHIVSRNISIAAPVHHALVKRT